MNRFHTIKAAMLAALTETLEKHPNLFVGLSYDDARALGREAADRAVGHLLLTHVTPNIDQLEEPTQ